MTTAGCEGDIFPELSVERLEIAAPRQIVAVGDSLQLRATAYGTRDRPLTGSKVVIGWASSAPAVAAVNPSSGVVIGFAPGRATIRAMARGRQDSVTITVVTPTP